MPSSPQTVPTVVLFDYLLNDGGVAIANARVTVVLNSTKPATSISPPTSIAQTQQSTTTDANGYWQFSLIPQGNINPSGTTYTVQTPDSAYDVTLGSVGPYQSTAFGTIVNVPTPLTAASSSIASLLVAAGEPGIDTATAGALLLGDNNATSIELGTATNTQGLLTAAAGEVISGGTGATLNASGDLAVRSVTVSSGSGPYTPSSAPGTIENYFFLPPPNGVDDTANINAVKAAALAQMIAGPWQGATIVAQPGIYRVSSQLVWSTKGLSLEGAGTAGTTIRPIAGISGSCILLQAGSCRFSNLFFQPFATQQASTTLAVQINALATVTQITVATVPTGGWATGAILRIGGTGGGSSQYVTVTNGPYAAGGSNVVVTIASFKAYFTYGVGAAVQDERFSTSAVAADGIQITSNASDISLDNIRFYYLNGWCINLVRTGGNTGFDLNFNNLYGQHCANGINLLGGTTTTSAQTNMTNVGMDTIEVGDCFLLDSCADVQGTTLWGGGYGNAIHIRNNTAAAFFDNCDFGGLEGFQNPMILIENPAAGDINHKPRVLGFTDCLVENGTTGVTITDCDDVSFKNLQVFQNAIDGMSITGGDLIHMDGCNFWQNNQSQTASKAEINVTSTTARIQVDRPRFQSTLVSNAIIVPATNAMVLTDPILAGPPALFTTNPPLVQDSNWASAGGQGKTIWTASNPNAGLVVKDLGGNGPGIFWTGSAGNGGKYVRVNGNVWQLVNNAYTTVLMTSDDSGNVGANGSVAPGNPGLGTASVTHLFSGSGVPSNANGANGDFYFRTDTPGTANQRLYIKSAGAWVALTL